MARPTQVTIDSGSQAWDSTLNDQLTKLFGGPLPVYRVATVAAVLALDATQYEDCLVMSLDTRETWKSDGTVWRTFGIGMAECNGARSSRVTAMTLVTAFAGATKTAAGIFPAGSYNRALSYRVTTLVTSGDGGTDMKVGNGTDDDLYGAGVAFALGTEGDPSDATADPTGWTAAAGDIVFTCNGGTFSAGEVRLVASYDLLTAPTA